MTILKITVSLPEPLVSGARRAVRRGRSTSVSAYIADAVAERAKTDDLANLLTELLAETGGPLTPAEKRRADALLRRPAKRKRHAA